MILRPHRISAEDILNMSIDELFEFPHVLLELVFHDGVIVTTIQRTIWSYLLWDILKDNLSVPVSRHFHIGTANVTPMMHATILSRIMTACRPLYVDAGLLYQRIHNSFNNMYNVLTTRLQEYVGTTSALDLLEAMEHPRILELNTYISNNPRITAPEIDRIHEEIEEILLTDTSLMSNAIAIALRNNLVKSRQMIQCISARGYMSEVNGQNFKTPMLTSYSAGMRTLSAYAMDSRTASIAAFSQESTMRTFQYQNRSFQILNSTITNLHKGDCGTRSTTQIFIDTAEKLKQYVGMYRMDDNEQWVLINTRDLKLLNVPLRVRTLTDCINPDRHGFCYKCFGDLAHSMIEGDKIGALISGHVQSKLSQGALSVKHFSSNTLDSIYYLSIEAKKYFSEHPTKHTTIMLNPFLVERKGTLIFDMEEVRNLNNLDNVESIQTVSIGRYTKISQIGVEYTEGEWTTSETVSIENNSKSASLTAEALLYLLENKWTVDDRGFYRVDMSRWDVKQPFMQVPRKKTDMVLSGKRFDEFLKGVSSKGRRVNNSIVAFSNFGDAMMAFQEITIEHIPMRVSHMQIMLYGLLAADPANNDYRLPNPTDRKSATFVTFRDKLNNGNLAIAMAYERQGGILMNPLSYINTNRSFSDYEFFILGGEKLKGV